MASTITERIVVEESSNGAMIIKYPVDIDDQDLAFLRRFIELDITTSLYRETIEERLQDIIAFFQFLIDDVVGPDQRLYRLCEQKVFIFGECAAAFGQYIGNEISLMLMQNPTTLLSSYRNESESIDTKYIERVQNIINTLVDKHDFQIFILECDEDGEYNKNNKPERQKARIFIQNMSLFMNSLEEEYDNHYDGLYESENDADDEEIDPM